MSAKSKRSPIANQPIAVAYLVSLDRALVGSENREEIVASVREHIEDALGQVDGDSDEGAIVQKTLKNLGPVERIVSMQGVDSPVDSPVDSSTESRWQVSLFAILAAASLVLVFVVPIVAILLATVALTWGIFQLRRSDRHRSRSMMILVVVISGLTLVIAILGTIFLLPRSSSSTINDPIPSGLPFQSLETSRLLG